MEVWHGTIPDGGALVVNMYSVDPFVAPGVCALTCSLYVVPPASAPVLTAIFEDETRVSSCKLRSLISIHELGVPLTAALYKRQEYAKLETQDAPLHFVRSRKRSDGLTLALQFCTQL